MFYFSYPLGNFNKLFVTVSFASERTYFSPNTHSLPELNMDKEIYKMALQKQTNYLE